MKHILNIILFTVIKLLPIVDKMSFECYNIFCYINIGKANIMPKFFIDKNDIKENFISISGGDATHISKVLRLKTGDNLTLCDGCGTDFDAQIISFTKDSVELSIKKSRICLAEPNVKVTLFQGLPKQGKMDFIIEKCTEMGIFRIVPVLAKRSVVTLRDDKAEDKKLSRWRKIASESVKQCGRGEIPEISDVVSFKEAVELSKDLDLVIAPYENEVACAISSALRAKTPKTVGIFIGPEGGIADEEIAILNENGIKTVTLGKRILRTETAGLAALTAVMYEYGELN